MKRNIDTIPADLRAPLAEIRAGAAEPVKGNTLEQVEREHIIHVLRQTDGVIRHAALGNA